MDCCRALRSDAGSGGDFIQAGRVKTLRRLCKGQRLILAGRRVFAVMLANAVDSFQARWLRLVRRVRRSHRLIVAGWDVSRLAFPASLE